MKDTHAIIVAAVRELEHSRDQALADLATCRTELAVRTKERDLVKEQLHTMHEKFRDLSVACQELDLTGEHATIVGIRKAMLRSAVPNHCQILADVQRVAQQIADADGWMWDEEGSDNWSASKNARKRHYWKLGQRAYECITNTEVADALNDPAG